MLLSSLPRLGLLALLLTCAPQSCLAQAFVESIWPPVVQRGKVNRIQLTGSQVEHVVDLWTSVPSVSLDAVSVDKGDGRQTAIDLRVPPNAPLGLYGLRLATRSGLSNTLIFLIDELPVSVRPDTTSTDEQPTVKLQLPACVAAPCRAAAIDCYSIDVKSGQRLTFEVIGNRFGKNYDPLITIRDSSNRIVAQCDNSEGLFFDCRFEKTFSKQGTYVVEVSDARYEGDPDWNYVLRIGEFPVARVALPSLVPAGKTTPLMFPQMQQMNLVAAISAGRREGEQFYQEVREATGKPATWVPLQIGDTSNRFEKEPNDGITIATLAVVPTTLNGVLSRAGDTDWFQFELAKGQAINVRGAASRFGSPADLELVLFEPTKDGKGREARRIDQTTVRNTERNTTFVNDANFSFTARSDGVHSLLVNDLSRRGGTAFAYRVRVENAHPELRLESEVARLTVPQQSFQPVPLKITRSGFKGPIELSLLGAPKGIALEPSTIPEDATEFVCRLTATDQASVGLATIQILGRFQKEQEEDGQEEAVAIEAIASTHPLIDRQIRNKDRILLALRPDQRRLPFSLSDRIALQITPPPPFDIELPDQDVLLPKYQTAAFRIVTKRRSGFSAPLKFHVRGGQIGDEAEERVSVFARIPDATLKSSRVEGTLFTRILARYEKRRIDVTATGRHAGHNVSLTRSFTLDVRTAFAPKFDPATLDVEPGQTVLVKVPANRVPTFNGLVTLTDSNPQSAFVYQPVIEIPPGKAEVEFKLQVKPDTAARRYQLRFESVGYVGKYQERLRSPILTINVKQPKKQAKKQ
jgi:hypothetical protein